MSAPTDLDLTVLGVIARTGPLTAYAVRMEFAASPAPPWSSSAGSVYPAIKRLVAHGLVSSGQATDRRKRQQLTITTAGQHALHRWLLELDASIGHPTPEPIRTRAQFIHGLSAVEQRRFFDRSIEVTQKALRKVKEKMDAESAADVGVLLGGEGAMAELKARLAWLQAARDR